MDHVAVEMRNITKVFNNKAANDSVNFQLRRGSIHGLLGENGAGKTTLMNILYGLYKPDGGEILLNGEPTVIDSPERAITLGIGMVHQHFMLANPLSVTENIMAGKFAKRQILLRKGQYRKAILDLAARYHMNVDPDSLIWQNSVGEQQRIEILSVLYQDVDILILDEPTAVLTPSETNDLFVTLRALANDGKSIIMITHKLEEVLQVADEVTVLRNGKNVGICDIDDTVCTRDLSKMMVGYDIKMHVEGVCKPAQEAIALSVDNLYVKSDKGISAVNDVSFSIRKGEILGIAGVDGNGQKELCEALTGIRPVEHGSIRLNEQDITHASPAVRIRAKVAYVPEDRKEMGLALGWDLAHNLVLKTFGSETFAKHGMILTKVMNKHARTLIEQYDIRANSEADIVKDLSGGNQQKVILARELCGEPELLIVNQPTRGVDVNAALNIRNRILDSRNKGTAVLLVSADLEEIMQLSDRIAVLYGGEIMGVLPGDATVATIGPLMLGEREVHDGA